jgi:hypothetical protein
MYQKSIRHIEREKVEAVIRVFGNKISDIKAVSDRREASAALVLQLLDQMSHVLFDGGTEERVRRFIEIYMPIYGEIDIFGLFTRSMAFNYSVEKSSELQTNSMLPLLDAVGGAKQRWFVNL